MAEQKKQTDDARVAADGAVVVMAAGKDAAPMLKKWLKVIAALLTALILAAVWLALETRALRTEVVKQREAILHGDPNGRNGNGLHEGAGGAAGNGEVAPEPPR